MLPLSIHEQRGEQNELRAVIGAGEGLGDLLCRLTLDAIAAHMAVLAAGAGPQDTKVVGDFGDRSDSGSRIVSGRLLFNRDRRRQTSNRVVSGLFHLAKKLPRIRGQALDVTPLPLSVEGVEGQGRLSRAGDAGHDDELLLRDVDVDRLEIMFRRAADLDVIEFSGGSGRATGGPSTR